MSLQYVTITVNIIKTHTHKCAVLSIEIKIYEQYRSIEMAIRVNTLPQMEMTATY